MESDDGSKREMDFSTAFPTNPNRFVGFISPGLGVNGEIEVSNPSVGGKLQLFEPLIGIFGDITGSLIGLI